MLKHVHAPQVFTTCGSAAKRAFLQKTFPWLEDSNIGDSRSTSFEATVLGQACPYLMHLVGRTSNRELAALDRMMTVRALVANTTVGPGYQHCA